MSEKIKSLIKDIENTINTPALEITIPELFQTIDFKR
jgi:hypothetical protein